MLLIPEKGRKMGIPSMPSSARGEAALMIEWSRSHIFLLTIKRRNRAEGNRWIEIGKLMNWPRSCQLTRGGEKKGPQIKVPTHREGWKAGKKTNKRWTDAGNNILWAQIWVVLAPFHPFFTMQCSHVWNGKQRSGRMWIPSLIIHQKKSHSRWMCGMFQLRNQSCSKAYWKRFSPSRYVWTLTGVRA